MNKIVVGTVGLFLLGASPVFANSLTDSGSEPEVQTSNGIPYVSGGFGLSERTELRGIGKTDNLELSFAPQNKDYIGGAEVRIKDKNGTERSRSGCRWSPVFCQAAGRCLYRRGDSDGENS